MGPLRRRGGRAKLWRALGRGWWCTSFSPIPQTLPWAELFLGIFLVWIFSLGDFFGEMEKGARFRRATPKLSRASGGGH
jgi:hypothetical protein